MPGPEFAGERFFLAADAPMELSGHLVDFVDGKLVAIDTCLVIFGILIAYW